MRVLRCLKELVGRSLVARDGEIGTLTGAWFDDEEWVVRHYLVHVGTPLTGYDVLVEPQQVEAATPDGKHAHVAVSRAEICESPLAEPLLADPAPAHLFFSEAVCGYRIHSLDGDIGRLEDLILEEGNWRVRYLGVDTSDWWPGRMVLLAPTWIEHFDRAGKILSVKLDRETIRTAPAYDHSRPPGSEDEARVYQHFYCHRSAGQECPPADR